MWHLPGVPAVPGAPPEPPPAPSGGAGLGSSPPAAAAACCGKVALTPQPELRPAEGFGLWAGAQGGCQPR